MIKASDIPEPAKRALLQHIRGQIGESQYRELAESVGEDKLLELALQLQPAPVPARERARPSPATWLVWVAWIAAAALLGGLGWLVGGRVGWIFGGAAMGLAPFALWLGSPGSWPRGVIPGGMLGGAIGGGVGASADAAFWGGVIGGFAGLLFHLGLRWLTR